jgi:pimeloyl-ACP methyl ester carboxylesterase
MNISSSEVSPAGQTIPEVTHHRISVNGTEIHYVTAGRNGSPILLVHGFPETWWTFHKIIPLLAKTHRVIAPDLRGFGDSGNGEGRYDSAASAEDLHQLIRDLGLGPVHLTGQDIAGSAAFRFAASYPEDVASFTAIEMGLPGLGLEVLADVTRGGAWHIGMLAAPGIPEMLLAGRERAFLGSFAFPALSATPGAITDKDVEEFARTYSRPGGWRGAAGLYRSMLAEGADIRQLADMTPLKMPVLAIGAGGGRFTADTMAQTNSAVASVVLESVGHYAAMEAPAALAGALGEFIARIDAARPDSRPDHYFSTSAG